MQWNETLQTRFNELRQRELAGMLDEEEQYELAKLYAIIDADEEIYLGGAIERMGKIAATAQKEISEIQKDNASLARIISQQEQLIQDANRWLAEFERRHELLQQSYAKLG